jgi:hypothetical protein
MALAACVSVLAGGSPCFASAASGVGGFVLDRELRPLPGATVTVTDRHRGVSRSVVTGPRGEFRVAPLDPGDAWEIRVDFPGMATQVLGPVVLAAGGVRELTLFLVPESEVRERVTITAPAPVISPDAGTDTRFSSEFTDLLPILGRNYQDVLTLAPGVSDIDGDGNPNIHGARDTDVRTLVDGVSTVDPYTGGLGQQLNFESIQEIEIKTAGAGAEYGRAQGGFVNVVTRSGGNEFEGSFKFFWRGDRLDGDGAGVDDPRLHGGVGGPELEFDDLRAFLSVGGPILKDRAWYFLSGETVRRDDPVGRTLQPYVFETRERRGFGKLTWQINPVHKLVLSAIMDPQTFANDGIESNVRVESGYTQSMGGTNLVLRETTILGPLAFLETTAQHFRSRPGLTPTLDPDTNGNGVLFTDRNGNGLIEATELDPGDDWDADGAWDVFEADRNENDVVDPAEDRDGDGRHTIAGLGCEGETREDRDCDGTLDDGLEGDRNGNGRFDEVDDLDGDGQQDTGFEDANGNGILDDRPWPQADDVIFGPDGAPLPLPAHYPYPRLRPLPPDLLNSIDTRDRVSGPYYLTASGKRSRYTLRQDLSLSVPDRGGQHDIKIGGIVERENYGVDQTRRPILFDVPGNKRSRQAGDAVNVILPAEGSARNRAGSMTTGIYLQDTLRPRPGLVLSLGLRLEREVTDSFGYTYFDPERERAVHERLTQLGGIEHTYGDSPGDAGTVINTGITTDPFFGGMVGVGESDPMVSELLGIRTIALSRFTRHHLAVPIVAAALEDVFPDVTREDPITGEREFDYRLLLEKGAATFQTREAFRLTNHNLAPRLAIMWDPSGAARTRLFATWGRYYDKLFLQSVAREEGPDTITRLYVADPDGVDSDGLVNNGLGAPISLAPPDVSQVDRGLQTPYSDELTLGFERELSPEFALEVTFIDRKFRQQLQDRDVNHITRNDPSGGIVDLIGRIGIVPRGGAEGPESEGSGFTHVLLPDGLPDLYVRNYFFNQVLRVGNYNEARYRGIVLQLTRRLRHNWQMQGSYTYSRARGAAESFLSELGNDPSAVQDEFGYLDYDERHVVKTGIAAYLPRDWQIGAILRWGSGLPYSIVETGGSVDDASFGQYRTLYGYKTLLPDGGSGFVHIRRNSLRNHARWDLNVLARKSLVLGRTNAQIILSVENLLNRDDLTISRAARRSDPAELGFEVVSERRFGRRFEIGMAVEF